MSTTRRLRVSHPVSYNIAMMMKMMDPAEQGPGERQSRYELVGLRQPSETELRRPRRLGKDSAILLDKAVLFAARAGTENRGGFSGGGDQWGNGAQSDRVDRPVVWGYSGSASR